MYITQDIANRIKLSLKPQHKTVKDMLCSLGLGINTISELSKGKQLSCISLAKIADYLNCSVDYLLGRPDNTELNSEHNLSDQEEKLLDAFRSTDELGRMRIIQFVMNESDKTTVKMVADNKNSISPIVRKKPRHT